MKEYKEIAWRMERIFHKFMQHEKTPQQYCDGIVLTQSEIDTIAIVGDNEGINITQLAKFRGITKGAVSQMIYRLVDKGLVEKKVSDDSDSAVSLFLTKRGKQARAEHLKMHETFGAKFTELMDTMPEEKQKDMLEFIEAFEEMLDQFN